MIFVVIIMPPLPIRRWRHYAVRLFTCICLSCLWVRFFTFISLEWI